MEPQPSKTDIEAIFHRLRSIPANKMCFDCQANNPTWASVTYGVFICIDCSAVHRSLGVHLTFVRSTQLDTNWTWVQLRQMQLGGNSNATQFFSQHNCNTNDAQKKYNSRAAHLYRDKLNQAALTSLKTNKELYVHPYEEKLEGKQEEDFFSEHEKFVSPDLADTHISVNPDDKISEKHSNECLEGPNVNFSLTSASEPRKSTLGARKPPAKKSGLGVKKGGLGATKVKTNFADLEREAEMAEATRLRMTEESAKKVALSAKEAEENEAAVRLAYKDISEQQHKKEEQIKKQDPKKAEQVERLGMGINARSGVSHSALNDMQVIEQENVQTTQSTLSSLGKLRISDTDYFEDYISGTGIYAPGFNSSRSKDFSKDFFGESNSGSKDSWVVIDDFPEKNKSRPTPIEYEKPREKKTVRNDMASSSDEAQKKFGNAKAISSDQYFNDGAMDYETKANLNRFQGSSSISSADFFGNGNPAPSSSSSLAQYDMDDVKESVRQGVTKVAGKLGSLANGLMTSIQDRYGY